MNNIKTLDDYLALPEIKATHRIAYGENPQQFGDLYLPVKEPNHQTKNKPNNKTQNLIQIKHPTIILLHGGCWRKAIDLSGLGQLCESLCKLGYAVWNLEYRRLDNGGGWPTTFQDVALGTDFLSQIAKQYSLDLSQVITMGHSAGGHLALWLAARNQLSSKSDLFVRNPLYISSVISLAGMPDLESAANEIICRGNVETLMGGMPHQVPEYYQQVSLNQFEPINIPIFHLIGEYDQVVPVNYLQNYIKTQANPNHSINVIADIGHFELVMPKSQAWDSIQETLQQITHHLNQANNQSIYPK